MKHREIKFRAWDGERMYIIRGQGLHLVIWNDPTRIAWGVYDASEARLADSQYGGALMQYTGLKDKTGREIYEGDMPGGVWSESVVIWCDKCCSFSTRMVEVDGHCHQCDGDCHWMEFVQDVKDGKVMVLGNIYENPELMPA